jgi:hypothetical protein
VDVANALDAVDARPMVRPIASRMFLSFMGRHILG